MKVADETGSSHEYVVDAPPVTELPENDSSVKLAVSKVAAPTAPPVWSAWLPRKLLRTRLMPVGESCKD